VQPRCRFGTNELHVPGTRTPTWRVDRLPHPAVPLVLALDDDDALVYVSLGARLDGLMAHALSHRARLVVERRRRTRARTELREYLAGRRTRFEVTLRPLGTEFQLAVWRALAEIPYGATRSYGELADHIDNPGGARAVGRANHLNPLPLVLPCHRVIGADGELVGFGGGLPTKRWLLQLEQQRVPPPWSPSTPQPQQLGLFG
jgi:methylated-DNA-[protein]-cysteine S-methyltransferase